MFITKAALAAALALGSASLALAQEGEWGFGGQDGNLANRIPFLNEPGVYGYGIVGGARMLLPKRSTAEALAGTRAGTARAGTTAAPAGTLRSAAVSLTPGRTGAARAAPSADDQHVLSIRNAVASVYPETGTGVGGTLRGLGFSARTGIFREDVVALGLARLYGGGARTQTQQVGMYGGGYGIRTAPVGMYGGYGIRTAQVGLYGRASPATRMYRRAAFRGTPVGQYLSNQPGQVEPISGGSGY